MVTSIAISLHKNTEVMRALSKEVLVSESKEESKVLDGGRHFSYTPYAWSIRGFVIWWFCI